MRMLSYDKQQLLADEGIFHARPRMAGRWSRIRWFLAVLMMNRDQVMAILTSKAIESAYWDLVLAGKASPVVLPFIRRDE